MNNDEYLYAKKRAILILERKKLMDKLEALEDMVYIEPDRPDIKKLLVDYERNKQQIMDLDEKNCLHSKEKGEE